ncbi:cytochrome c oxidase assembly protein [Novosphingopyxis sp.]|uniref:cytochrome c oxidase assembly protein n=1 Tax=Novosphingopyxis sp. TaxID=2709690 RepID=UPI003B5AAAC4
MRVSETASIPYCGSPPTAATIDGRWNLDPVLLAALLGIALLYYLRVGREKTRREAWCFGLGWATTALALVSPLCALSVSLFAARVGQHMILTLVAAPLIALGLPASRRRVPGQELCAALAFAMALWIWHSPRPYDATFLSTAVYWTMHVTTWGAAVFFWWTVLRAPASRFGISIAATVATGLQMALLGAVITWARAPLYWPHFVTPIGWGFTPLQDQQLGGTLMWVPGGSIFLAAIIVPLAIVLRRPAYGARAGAMRGA